MLGLKKKKTRQKNVKVHDCFTFFNELDLLKIRLEYLYDVVDEFWISEANITHSGIHKAYEIQENFDQLKPWADKIRYLKYSPDTSALDFKKEADRFNEGNASWRVERGQRDLLLNAAATLSPDDLMLVGDIDEIPSRELLLSLKSGEFPCDKSRLEMDMYYYYMNCKGIGADNSKWIGAFISRVSDLNLKQGLSFMRVKEKMPHIKDGGWHFSYLGGADQVSKKLNSFAHTELNTSEINNLQHLKKCIELGVDHLGRGGHDLAFLPVDRFPQALADLMRCNLKFLKHSLL